MVAMDIAFDARLNAHVLDLNSGPSFYHITPPNDWPPWLAYDPEVWKGASVCYVICGSVIAYGAQVPSTCMCRCHPGTPRYLVPMSSEFEPASRLEMRCPRTSGVDGTRRRSTFGRSKTQGGRRRLSLNDLALGTLPV
eukprot:289286-Rhodomonas_salina.1